MNWKKIIGILRLVAYPGEGAKGVLALHMLLAMLKMLKRQKLV